MVPLYNETDRFAEHGDELASFIDGFPEGSEIIFVDDGSDDDTAGTVERFIARAGCRRLRLLRRPHAGKGAAVSAGLSAATAAFAGFCDVDLSTPLSCLDDVLIAAQRSAGLAIGSRDLDGADVRRAESAARELLGRAFNRFVRATVAPGIADTQCGAKVAPTAVWHAILPHCTQSGFCWDVEAIVVARRLRLPIAEVPVAWTHDDRTRVRVSRDGPKMVLAVPSIMLRTRRVRHGVAAPERGPSWNRQPVGV